MIPKSLANRESRPAKETQETLTTEWEFTACTTEARAPAAGKELRVARISAATPPRLSQLSVA